MNTFHTKTYPFILICLILLNACTPVELAPPSNLAKENETPLQEDITQSCLNKTPLDESQLVEADNQAGKFFKRVDFEDGLGNGIKGTATTDFCYTGEKSMNSRSTVGGAYSTGGAVSFPTGIVNGGEVWIRFRIYFPSDYEFSSCTVKGLGGCVVTEGNDSIKFIGIEFNVWNQGRHWFNIRHDRNAASGPFFWVYEGHADSFKWISTAEYNLNNPNSDLPLPIQKGRWETFEYYTKFSTVPASQGGDAQARIYKNGKLIFESLDYRTINDPAMIARQVYLLEYWNGGAPASQSVYFDEIIMTNKTPKKRDENGNPYLGLE